MALKQAGRAVDDEAIGPFTWDVWMDKAAAPARRLGALDPPGQPPSVR